MSKEQQRSTRFLNSDADISTEYICKTIDSILIGIAKDEYGIPFLQRGIVWTYNELLDYITALWNDVPTNDVCFLETDRDTKYNRAKLLLSGDKAINIDKRDKFFLIVDGQQRNTVLYALKYGRKVKTAKKSNNTMWSKQGVRIAFNPLLGTISKFVKQKHENDPTYITDFKRLWDSTDKARGTKIINEYCRMNNIPIPGDLFSTVTNEFDLVNANIDKMCYLLENREYHIKLLAPETSPEDLKRVYNVINLKTTGKKLDIMDLTLSLVEISVSNVIDDIMAFTYYLEEKGSLMPSSETDLLRILCGVVLRSLRVGELEYKRLGKTEEGLQYLMEMRNVSAKVFSKQYWKCFELILLKSGLRFPLVGKAGMPAVPTNLLKFIYSFMCIGKLYYNVPEVQLTKCLARLLNVCNMQSNNSNKDYYYSRILANTPKELTKEAFINYSESLVLEAKQEVVTYLPELFKTDKSKAYNIYSASLVVRGAVLPYSQASVLNGLMSSTIQKHHLTPSSGLGPFKVLSNHPLIDCAANKILIDGNVNNNLSSELPKSQYELMTKNKPKSEIDTICLNNCILPAMLDFDFTDNDLATKQFYSYIEDRALRLTDYVAGSVDYIE